MTDSIHAKGSVGFDMSDSISAHVACRTSSEHSYGLRRVLSYSNLYSGLRSTSTIPSVGAKCRTAGQIHLKISRLHALHSTTHTTFLHTHGEGGCTRFPVVDSTFGISVSWTVPRLLHPLFCWHIDCNGIDQHCNPLSNARVWKPHRVRLPHRIVPDKTSS